MYKKRSFPLRISSVNTEEILNGKFHFLCNGNGKGISRNFIRDVRMTNTIW